MSEQDEKQTDPANINTELAKERTYAAYERTFLAWIRTAMAFMGFGIGIFEFATQTGGTTVFKSSKFMGLFLILLSMVMVFLALGDVKKNNTQLSDPNFRYGRKTTLGIKMGYVLLFLCAIVIIRTIYKLIQTGI